MQMVASFEEVASRLRQSKYLVRQSKYLVAGRISVVDVGDDLDDAGTGSTAVNCGC